MSIVEVIDAYNEMLSHYFKSKRGLRYSTKKNQEAVTSFLEWCAEHGVDEPVRFVKARIYFAKEMQNRPIFPKVTGLRSPSLLKNEWWRDLADWWELMESARREAHQTPPSRLEVLGRRRRGWERYKSRYRGRRRLCLSSPAFSGGYHPHSEDCQGCELKQECISKTNLRTPGLVGFRSSCRELLP